MIKNYKDNIYNICDLIKKLLGVKKENKIGFQMLNDLFDLDYDDNRLEKKIMEVITEDKKQIEPAILLLMLGESFEYFVKFEDKFNILKKRLDLVSSLNEMANIVMEDMWPFYPFFQEALAVFATLFNPNKFGGVTDLDIVLESSVRDFIFVDDDGFVIPMSFEQFFSDAILFISDSFETEYNILAQTKNMSFHEINEISEKINNEFNVFTFDFLKNYSDLSKLAQDRYNKVYELLNKKSIDVIAPEINAIYKYTKDTIKDLTFDIENVKNLDTLEAVNQAVNDLKQYSVTRYNEISEFLTSNNVMALPESYDLLSTLVIENTEGTIDYLYDLIDKKITVLEAKYEKKKRLQLVRDLSIKIKNFNEFLIGLKTEIGDMNNITKRQMGNFKCRDDAEFFLKRLQLQKTAYFKHVKVFEYLSMSIDLDVSDFKIYKRADFEDIANSIRTMEKFLNRVCESMLPEAIEKEESDFENEGRLVDISGNKINIALMNEDFSELSFNGELGHTFNIHDYSAYHNLVDFAVEVRKQPVFQDYGDISEYPYFKPFKYQVESVRTMLGRFEGKGVFGDQVGLGKTLEALMTADVMFRCATIKNCVIVTTETTIRQWRSEAQTKFRHEDGSPMFEIYPKHGSYSFRDLIKELVKDKDAKQSNALKIYMVSVEQIKSDDTLQFIKEASDFFGLKNQAYNPIPYVPSDIKVIDTDVSEINCFKHLDILKKRLPLELSREIKISLENNEQYKKITTFNVYGFFSYEFDESKKKFVSTNPSLYDKHKPDESTVLNEVLMLKAYTKKLSEIENRRKELLNELNQFKDKYSLLDKRLIDLLIFDEVQDLLYDLNKTDTKEAILQEFIANIQKKYCILISATPIKNDLSDIFNLLYMVDKNRLGETKEKAMDKFYNAYCGGSKSLSEMASKSDAKDRFRKLNGLINSMFTRKRLYDKDVIDSIRRHTATDVELVVSNSNNRDDYGGQLFVKLVSAIKRSSVMLDSENKAQFIDKYIRPLFPKYNLSDEVLEDAFRKLYYYVNEANQICVKRLEYELRMKLNNFDVFDKFIENYQMIIKYEKDGIKNDIYDTIVNTCNLLTNYINRGILAFYRTYQEYSLVFLSDFIDWRRPRKRGERIIINSDAQKVELFKELLTVTKNENHSNDFNKENLNAIHAGKILFYEKKNNIRYEIYKNIRDTKPAFGNIRRVYMTLKQKDEYLYDINDFVHFCYFPKGNKKDEMKKFISTLENKKELSFDEERLLKNWTVNGTLMKNEAEEDNYKGLNFKNFTEFTANNENWNSIYFIDDTMLKGTDFNAANILVIGQLDKDDNTYLDPLELEQLIGRISRMGQTEECIVFTCLYNGNDNPNLEFNKLYYDILTDELGFDIYGVCQTEVDFVMPVVMASAKRLFNKEYSYIKNDLTNFDNDKSDFKAVYENDYIESNINRFPDLVRYVYENTNNIKVYFNDHIYNPVDALFEMIRLYSKILRPEIKK
ncbi:MAG: hypothetical protein K6E20_07245 [Acholeplasmatales bacterium]|nr:hypothetical protein [Acholeplasmatales bacterium]